MAKLGGRITVTAVGKLRQKHWRTAQEEYVRRLPHYTKFELIEVKDVVGKGFPDEVAMQKEGEALLKATEGATRRIALTPNGVQWDSLKMAECLQYKIQVYGNIAFLIGGPLGFSEEVLLQCEEQFSLSPLTFPHELARVMLLEQLYRACTILSNEPYHK